MNLLNLEQQKSKDTPGAKIIAIKKLVGALFN
jgi:hypothetical protein